MEVPFFPRRFGRRRPRRPRWRGWLAIGLVASAGVGAPAVAWQSWRWSAHARHSSALAEALERLETAERRGDVPGACLAAEEARSLAVRHGLKPPGGLEALADRRDALALLDVGALLERLPMLPPDLAFAEAKAIGARVEADGALAGLARRHSGAMAEAALRWVDRHLARADEARASGCPGEALAIAEGLTLAIDALPGPSASRPREAVRSFALRLVSERGARVAPIAPASGPRPGEAAAYDRDLLPLLAEALGDRGYLVEPPGSPLAGFWSRAPFELRATIEEGYGPRYLQSPYRTTVIAVDLALDRDGRAVWSEHFDARTRVPLRDLGALEASRFALGGGEGGPEVERRLYRDARLDLLDKLRLKLRGLPPAPECRDS